MGAGLGEGAEPARRPSERADIPSTPLRAGGGPPLPLPIAIFTPTTLIRSREHVGRNRQTDLFRLPSS